MNIRITIRTILQSPKFWLFIFFLLSAGIILYPVRYFLSFSQLEGLQVFVQPIYFMGLLDAWVGLYLAMVARFKLSNSQVTKLSMVTALVFAILQYRISPLGRDHDYFITFADTSYLLAKHNFVLPTSPHIYLAYPGLMFLTGDFVTVTHLSYNAASLVLTGIFFVVIAFCLQGLVFLLTKNTLMAAVSVPLYFVCSYEAVSNILFFPATLGVTFLALSLYLIARNLARLQLLLLILSSAMIITHFYDVIALIFVITALGVSQWQIFGAKIWKLCSIIVLGDVFWHILIARAYLSSILGAVIASASLLFSNQAFSYAFLVTSTNTFAIPLWATLVRYFDIVSTSIVGVFVSFLFLIRRKNQSKEELNFAIMTLAILTFGLLAAYASIFQGGFDFLVGIQFAVFLTVPLMFRFIQRPRLLKIFAIVLIVVVSGPSLLVLQYRSVSTNSVYPSQIVAADWFAHYIPNKSLTVFTLSGTEYGSISVFDPLINWTSNGISIPVTNYPLSGVYYNVVDLRLSNYQLHLYSYPINFSDVYNGSVLYDDGTILITN
jgi:hypothetical protein